jgi:hypothetical protein
MNCGPGAADPSETKHQSHGQVPKRTQADQETGEEKPQTEESGEAHQEVIESPARFRCGIGREDFWFS